MAAEGEVPKGKNYYQKYAFVFMGRLSGVAVLIWRPLCSKKKKGIKRAKEAAKEAAKQSRVDGATLEYWRRVEDTLAADEFEEEEDKALFITNVLSVLDGSELTLARDQAVSRIMEKLLQAANEFQVRVFMDRLSGRYLEMTKDRVASHVVQRVLAIVPRLIAGASGQVDMEQEDDNDGLRSAEGLFLAMVDELVCPYILSN
jgi:nucleolar protein 9